MKSRPSISINLDHVESGLLLCIDAKKPETLFDAHDSAVENNEARFQLVEGCYYDYEFNSDRYQFLNDNYQIVQPHSRKKHIGIIAPNIYVGTISLPIAEIGKEEVLTSIELEVQSVKTGYRDDYRDMLEFITEKCTDLLLQANSPASQYFEIDYSRDSQTLYQKFAFINSFIGTDDFAEALHRIVTTPVTTWTEITENRDIRRVRRFSNTNIQELLRSSNRTSLPTRHFLREYGLDTICQKMTSIRKKDSVDTPENRFIKHVLESFLKFCTDINNKAVKGSRLDRESQILIRELESQLHHAIFNAISRPNTLKLNSPVLQRKEGYREVLRVWLMFDLAARLIWSGGDDIYSGGKKDIAILYEYWLFFKLLELLTSIFEIDPKDISDLIKETPDGLNLQLRQGKFTALRGVYHSGIRKLNVRFNFNRSFNGEKAYPDSGSWTTTLRPDYTLSLWPYGIKEAEAEKQELIVHIHFDAKYKVAGLFDLIENKTEDDLNEEKTDNRRGIYRNADLLKMHAYKDAIRRTGGAYVLYPGDGSVNQHGFHEIIPGLGAFAVRPSKTDSGIGDLKSFILEILDHLINRTSQREKLAFRTFDIHKAPPDPDDAIKEPLPEIFNANRDLIPDDTYVLIGFYQSPEQYDWIQKKGLYNFRIGTRKGSLVLEKETVSSRFLLLHTSGDKASGDLWRIKSKGPSILSREDLTRLGYPNPSDYYLVIEIEQVLDPEFQHVKWDFRKLKNYSSRRRSALPFTASLTELMKTKIN